MWLCGSSGSFIFLSAFHNVLNIARFDFEASTVNDSVYDKRRSLGVNWVHE